MTGMRFDGEEDVVFIGCFLMASGFEVSGLFDCQKSNSSKEPKHGRTVLAMMK
mgnify:FL=1